MDDVKLFHQEQVKNVQITQKLDGSYAKAMNRPKGTVSAKIEILCKLLEKLVIENSIQYVDREEIIGEAEHIIYEFSLKTLYFVSF